MCDNEPKSELAPDLGDRLQSQNVPLALLLMRFGRRNRMEIYEIRKKKLELGYSTKLLAERIEVPIRVLEEFLENESGFDGYDVEQIRESVEQALYEREYMNSSGMSETKAVYGSKRQGEYTLEDYYQIPDEQRVELIDGVIYDMAAPYTVHQIIAGYIYAKLLGHVQKNNGSCLPMIAPVDVQLDCDNKTIVQPDVMILCDRDKLKLENIVGAPDFIVEVLSESTRSKDMVIKLNKYMNAGVKEYWMVDLRKKRVLVYEFERKDYPTIYGFDAEIPVGIWHGECKVDFAEIYEKIRFLVE